MRLPILSAHICFSGTKYGIQRRGALPVGAELTQEIEKSFDWLFSALDGKPADGAPARILAIYDDGREWWIQVARGDDDINTIVLRLSRFATAIHAGAAIRRWHSSGSSAPHIVRAMSLI
jgi:hypothetical protein